MYLVYTRQDSNHHTIAEHLAVLTESFLGLYLGLVVNVHPVAFHGRLQHNMCIDTSCALCAYSQHGLHVFITQNKKILTLMKVLTSL